VDEATATAFYRRERKERRELQTQGLFNKSSSSLQFSAFFAFSAVKAVCRCFSISHTEGYSEVEVLCVLRASAVNAVDVCWGIRNATAIAIPESQH
jgi:hypothetical protein